MDFHLSENKSLADDDEVSKISCEAETMPLVLDDEAPSPKKRFVKILLILFTGYTWYVWLGKIFVIVFECFFSKKVEGKRVVTVPMVEGDAFPPADSWTWRKYGQKPIKGSPFPRYLSYSCKY